MRCICRELEKNKEEFKKVDAWIINQLKVLLSAIEGELISAQEAELRAFYQQHTLNARRIGALRPIISLCRRRATLFASKPIMRKQRNC